MGTNDLDILLCDTPQEAPVYRAPEYKAGNLKRAVVVGWGTVNGNPTIDFIFEDESGQKYIAMITATLIEQLAAMARGLKERNGG